MLVENRKAKMNYEMEDKLEAGIELFGHEVKSIRAGQMTLDGSYVIIRGGEAFLINSNIPAYQEKNTPKEYNSRRNRKLLLNKKELAHLANLEVGQSLTIVPISLYNLKNKIKVELWIAKGKKKHDKRESIKKRESDREIRRTLREKY